MLLKWKPGQSQCLPRGEFVTLSVTAVNAVKYEWICNGVTVRCDADYCFRVDPSTCGVYKCLVHNRHGTVETPPISISMSDEPTSSSVIEAWYETTYRVGITPGPSTGECGQPHTALPTKSFYEILLGSNGCIAGPSVQKMVLKSKWNPLLYCANHVYSGHLTL